MLLKSKKNIEIRIKSWLAVNVNHQRFYEGARIIVYFFSFSTVFTTFVISLLKHYTFTYASILRTSDSS